MSEGKWLRKKLCYQKVDHGRYRSRAPISKQSTTSSARKTRFMVKEGIAGINECRLSADRFLQSSDAIGNVAIVDVHRIDLEKTLKRCFRLTRGFLGNT